MAAPKCLRRPRAAVFGWSLALAAGCAGRGAQSARGPEPPETRDGAVAAVKARQRLLEERIARLEDRLRLLEAARPASLSLSQVPPEPGTPAGPPVPPAAAPPAAEAGKAGAKDPSSGIRLYRKPLTLSAPNPAAAEAPAAESPAPPAFPADGPGDPAPGPSGPLPAAGGSDPGPPSSGARRSFRLTGRKLVELTKAPPKTRQEARPSPDGGRSGGRKRRAADPVVAAYREAMAALKAGHHERARKAFARIARAHPHHPYADNALYWKGEAAYDMGDYRAALSDFTAVVERYAGGNKAPDALLKIALCYQRLGRVAEARALLVELIEAYPRAHASDVARVKLAEIRG